LLVTVLACAHAALNKREVLSGIPSFRSAWAARVEAAFGGVRAQYLSLDDLVAAKRAAGRAQDMADLEALERAQRRATRRRARRPGARRRKSEGTH